MLKEQLKEQIVKQLKSQWENRDNLKKQFFNAVGSTKATFKQKTTTLLEQSKSNPIVQNHIIPLIENEKIKPYIQNLKEGQLLQQVHKYKDKYITPCMHKLKDYYPNTNLNNDKTAVKPKSKAQASHPKSKNIVLSQASKAKEPKSKKIQT